MLNEENIELTGSNAEEVNKEDVTETLVDESVIPSNISTMKNDHSSDDDKIKSHVFENLKLIEISPFASDFCNPSAAKYRFLQPLCSETLFLKG